MYFTLFKFKDVSPLHAANAYGPIMVKESGKEIEVSLVL